MNFDIFYNSGSCVGGVQHKGDLCYTEDGIIVHNLYLSNIPKNVTEDDVRAYFAQYGEISLVQIREKKPGRVNKYLFRYGFVNFKEPKAAAKALKTQFHHIGVYHIRVKPADSWKQPAVTKTEENAMDQECTNDQNCEENNVEVNSILKLNDDCLLHIFSFLTLNEQLKLAGLCERFQSIFETIFRKKKSLNMYANGNLTLMEVRQIVTQVGHHIQEAHFEGYGDHLPTNHSRCLEFMSQSCINLRWLELSAVSNIHPDTYKRISLNLKNLTKLELRNCSITDLVCNHLSLLPELESLDVSENYELTGKYLAKFPKLTRLNLSHCANIQSKNFSELCKRRKLKSLNIKRCDRLNKSNFMEMENVLEDLEDLVISSCYQTDDLHHIAGLKNLRELTIFCSQSLKDNLFESLAERKAYTLETLVLIGSFLNRPKKDHICSLKGLKKLGILRDSQMDDIYLEKISNLPELTSLNLAGCPAITRTGLAALFQNTNNLQHIDVSCCHQFYTEAIYDIIDKIKVSKRTAPCTLYIGNTSVSNNITKDPKYLECASLLSLSFTICEFGVSFEFLDDDDDYLSDEDLYDDDIYDYYDSDDDDDDDLYGIDDLNYDPHFAYGEDFPLFWF